MRLEEMIKGQEPYKMKQFAGDDDLDAFPCVGEDGKEFYHRYYGLEYNTWHPDEIEDDEYNIIIQLTDGLALSRSCMFDFCEG